jgi:hypothetical protein
MKLKIIIIIPGLCVGHFSTTRRFRGIGWDGRRDCKLLGFDNEDISSIKRNSAASYVRLPRLVITLKGK